MKTISMKNKKIILTVIASILIAGYFYDSSHDTKVEALHPTSKYAMWAFALGAISAISLPLGAMAGLTFKPGPRLTAIFTAFGAGALLAALSVELIAPTVMEIVGQIPSTTGVVVDKEHGIMTMVSLIVGCILGGIIFYIFDELINTQGGHLRKVSTMISFLRNKNSKKKEEQITEDEDVNKTMEIKEEVKEHGGAAMGIWLGLLIDGIPESFVIGAGFLALLSAKLTMVGATADFAFSSIIPYTLIAGLFLSNFPEALSASMGMKKQGMKTSKILMMWFSLVLLVGIGTVVGYFLGASVPHMVQIGIEGLAAGAMLTMIAQTMIPEAVHIGGDKVVGLSVLVGYLSAVAFKLLE